MVVDALIIGSGVAGLTCADFLAKNGCSVLLVTKTDRATATNTYYAQGGIIGDSPEDDPDRLAADIEAAGAGLCHPDAVRLVVEEGPALVRDYLWRELGVPFSMDGDDVDRTAEGAHSVRRIFHTADYTGRAIEVTLLRRLREHRCVSIRTGAMAVDLITNTHHAIDPLERYRDTRCLGAYIMDVKTGTVDRIFAHHTVLATGGLGMAYLHTTNPRGATGDGIAMAWRAGIPILNAEFVQFHPTTLYLSHSEERFLISESVRGEGAVLVGRAGDRFMADVHPDADLAARDVVARAIFQKMLADDSPCVYLDLSNMAPGLDFETRFPQITEACRQAGIQVPAQRIPVVPAAHYFCGGIKTDLSGSTALPGLYAIGECACNGLHGANRLASTSLLEGVVFGRAAARAIAGDGYRLADHYPDIIPAWRMATRPADPVLIQNDVKQVRTTMWNYAGIIRTRDRLERARRDMNQLADTIEHFYRKNRLTRSLVELRNLVTVGRLIALAAERNRNSAGCHFRADEPSESGRSDR